MAQKRPAEKARILFVDDEPLVCRSFARHARNHGFIVDTTQNGEEALSFVERYPYSVVVTDLLMPGVNGIELIERVHKMQPEATCVIVTGLPESEIPDMSSASEKVFEIVHKPWDDTQLRQLLEDAIRDAPYHNSMTPIPVELSLTRSVLLVEDNLGDAKLVSHYLAAEVPNKYNLIQVERLDEAEAFLRNKEVGAVLLDLSLPDGDGLESVARIRDVAPKTPIIVLSGMTDESIALEAVKGGAQDYLMKGEADGRAIDRAISYATERSRLQLKLESLARFDQLTGLANRMEFLDRLNNTLLRARRTEAKGAVLFIDLDGFKSINDTFGHDVGDELLREVARRLDDTIREVDVLARLGGDEFAILLEGLESDVDAAIAAQRLINSFATPVIVDDKNLSVSLSVGIALYPDTAMESTELLKSADSAMYQAKSSGKATYRFFDAGTHDRTVQRIRLEDELRRALERDEFVLYYQPQLRLADLRVLGFEALLRWRNPEGELVPPGQFIPILEDTGLIIPVGQWVLEEASRQTQTWRNNGWSSLRMAVNLSVRQFDDTRIVETVRNALVTSELEPAGLELEITENILITDTDAIAAILAQFQALGSRCAIDDFGTGYSSFRYLPRLPIDVLKLDRCFTSQVASSERDALVATSIITVAHNLGLEVIAEGVETSEQESFLLRNACEIVQGYRYGKPMCVADAEQWLLGQTEAKAS